MYSINCLLTEKISQERFSWFKSVIFNANNIKIKFFITGSALYSLVDSVSLDNWINFSKKKDISIYVDSDEIRILGIKEIINNNFRYRNEISPIYLLDFWGQILKQSNAKIYSKNFGYLQLHGPYMHRSSVYSIKSLRSSLLQDLNTEFYGYLDGVHMGHKDQNPSEYENIGKKMEELSTLARQKDLNFKMLACSRCGTARGYYKRISPENQVPKDDAIHNYSFGNLNRIIDRFEEQHLIYSSNSMSVQNGKPIELIDKPPILLLITNPSYNSEFTFGGLSFAVACANHEIHTDVLFIEDGIYSIIGKQEIDETDKIFNVQEIINATADMEYLHYNAFKGSIKNRTLIKHYNDDLTILDEEGLSNLITQNNLINSNHKRIIFF